MQQNINLQIQLGASNLRQSISALMKFNQQATQSISNKHLQLIQLTSILINYYLMIYLVLKLNDFINSSPTYSYEFAWFYNSFLVL